MRAGLRATAIALACSCSASPAAPRDTRATASGSDAAAALQSLLAGKTLAFQQPSQGGAFCSEWEIVHAAASPDSGTLVRDIDACGRARTFVLRYRIVDGALELSAHRWSKDGVAATAGPAAPDRLVPSRRTRFGVDTDMGSLHASGDACIEAGFYGSLPDDERTAEDRPVVPLALSSLARLPGSDDLAGGVAAASEALGNALLEVLDAPEAWFLVRAGTGADPRCAAWSIVGSRHHPDRYLSGPSSWHVIPLFRCGGLHVDGPACEKKQIAVDEFTPSAFRAAGTWWYATAAACEAARSRGDAPGGGPGCGP